MEKRTKSTVNKSLLVLNNEQLVHRYFQLIGQGDVSGLLDLFSEDAVVYEPFSNEQDGLQGKPSIENFLRVATMANAGMTRTIRFSDNHQDRVTALVTFERGGNITGKFTFYFATQDMGRKISILRIQFAGF